MPKYRAGTSSHYCFARADACVKRDKRAEKGGGASFVDLQPLPGGTVIGVR